MKSKEELAAIKTEYEAVKEKLGYLTEEELEAVTGGTGRAIDQLSDTPLLCVTTGETVAAKRVAVVKEAAPKVLIPPLPLFREN